MSINGLANAVMPQSHGNVDDFEAKVGKSNVSYATLRIQDPKANVSPTANHSFNIIGHTDYLDRLIAAEVSALDIFLKDAQSNVDIPQSYLDTITQELGMIRQDNSDYASEVKRQNAKTKEQELREKNIAAAVTRVEEQQDLASRSQENRAEIKTLTTESIKQNKENRAINDQVIKDIRDSVASENKIQEEVHLEKIIQGKMLEEQAMEKILQARDVEKITTDEIVERNFEEQLARDQLTQDIINSRLRERQIIEGNISEKFEDEIVIEEKENIQYAAVREQVREVREVQNDEEEVEREHVSQEKTIETQSLKNKSAGIEYTEEAIIVEENSLVDESTIAVENTNNVSVAESQEDNPEMLQMSFGVNLVV